MTKNRLKIINKKERKLVRVAAAADIAVLVAVVVVAVASGTYC